MGMEDDFLQNDVDDEKTIEYIKNYLPQELKEKFSDDEFYYFLDLIDEYYSESGILDVQPEGLHQRIGVILGSKNEVERVQRYHLED